MSACTDLDTLKELENKAVSIHTEPTEYQDHILLGPLCNTCFIMVSHKCHFTFPHSNYEYINTNIPIKIEEIESMKGKLTHCILCYVIKYFLFKAGKVIE